MQNEINNIDKPDKFNDFIREKLENHRVEVDAQIWDELEAKLQTKKRRIIPFWYWFNGGAAVAVLALLFTLRPVDISTNFSAKLQYNQTQKTQKINYSKTKSKSLTGETIQVDKNTNKFFVSQSQPTNKHQKTFPEIILPQDELIENTTKKVEKEKKDSTIQGSTSNQSFAKVEKKVVDSTFFNEKPTELPIWENPIAAKKQDNSGKGLFLAAAIGAGGSAPTGSNGYLSSTGDKNIVTAETNFSAVMAPNDFTDITYSTPVSFGVAVQKSLDESWKIESGFVYTYLSTTFKNGGVQQNNANLHLHYIGIPANLIFQILKSTKWNAYLSGGGMLEKGVRSIYIQHQYFGNQIITTSAATNIDGFQWSTNAAVGLTYKLQQNLGIYFEPKISYFFNNNQPISARTDQPVSIGLTAGLRFQLK